MLYLRKKKKGHKAKAPIEYALLKYRERFNMTWAELMETPWKVIEQDLEMLGIEEAVLHADTKQEPKHAAAKHRS